MDISIAYCTWVQLAFLSLTSPVIYWFYMGLFLNQQDKRSELQERIAADLREKALRNSKDEPPAWDGSKDIRYLEGSKETTEHGWAWILAGLIAIGIVIMFLVQSI